MSQKFVITNHLTPAIITTIEANAAAAKTISDLLAITMTSAQARAILKIGPIRGAEMVDIYTKMLKPFPQTIPSDYTLADYEALQKEQADSLLMAALYQAQANAYIAHANVCGNNLFLMSIEGLDVGRFLMNSNTGIATVVNEISTAYFTHTAANGATVYSIAPSMTLAVPNLVTGKRIVNDGTTIITMLVKGGGTPSTVTIYPGDSAIVPAGWTNITVTNVSATTTGSFQVFIK